MQFLILMLGALMFVFYQFTMPPVFFNESAWNYQVANGHGEELGTLQANFAALHAEKQQHIQAWLAARHTGDVTAESNARGLAMAAQQRAEAIRTQVKTAIHAADPRTSENDADYVFISFILSQLPHGAIGLLVAAFFAATLSSKAGELNALGSTTTVDIYRHLVKRQASDAHYVASSKWFTVFWGMVAIGFALFASLTENLVQAVNIVGSIFYGVVLALFLVAFFLRWIGGTAIFWAAVASQMLVFVLYVSLTISYLWYNVIGAAACVVLSMILQPVIGRKVEAAQV
jgi:SSS family solute:Na+ symporter